MGEEKNTTHQRPGEGRVEDERLFAVKRVEDFPKVLARDLAERLHVDRPVGEIRRHRRHFCNAGRVLLLQENESRCAGVAPNHLCSERISTFVPLFLGWGFRSAVFFFLGVDVKKGRWVSNHGIGA